MSQTLCASCSKPAYAVERVQVLGKNFHKTCLRCANCHKVLTTARLCEHKGELYCERPCYALLFGPHGFRGGSINPSSYG